MEFYDFPYVGNFIIPTDELIFFRGVAIPPASNSQSLNVLQIGISYLLTRSNQQTCFWARYLRLAMIVDGLLPLNMGIRTLGNGSTCFTLGENWWFSSVARLRRHDCWFNRPNLKVTPPAADWEHHHHPFSSLLVFQSSNTIRIRPARSHIPRGYSHLTIPGEQSFAVDSPCSRRNM